MLRQQQIKCCKGTGIVVPTHTMEAYKRSRYAPPLAIDLVTGWSWMVIFTPRPPYSRERTIAPTK